MATSNTIQIQITGDSKSLVQACQTAVKAIKGAGDAGSTQGNRLSAGWAAAVGAISGITQRVFDSVVSTISNSVDSAIKRVDTMNNFPKVMQSLGFAAEEASASVALISTRLDGLPTTMNDMVSNVQNLTATMGNLNQGTVNATTVGIAFNDMMLAGGQGTQAATNAFTQYNQMLAAGKVDQQAWNSLVTAAPGQMKQLAQSLLGAEAGQKDLYEAMKEGILTFDDMNEAIVRLDNEGGEGFESFEKQARAATGGIGTALENVQNRVSKAIATVIDEIGADNISNAINALSSKFADIGKAVANVVKFFQENEWAAKALETAFIALGAAMVGIKIAELGGKFVSLIGTVMQIGSVLFGTVIPAVASFGMTLLTTVIPAVISFTAALLANPITWIVLAIVALIAALVLLITHFDEVKAAVGAVFGWIGEFIGNVVEKIKSFFQPLFDTISGVFSAIGEFIGMIVDGIVAYFQWWWDTVTGIFSTLGEFFAGVFGVLASFFTGLWDGICAGAEAFVGFIQPAINVVVGIFQTLWTVISAIGEIFLKIGEIIAVLVYSTIAVAIEWIISTATSLWGTICGIAEAIGTFIGGVIENIKMFFVGLWTNLMEGLTAIGEFFNMIFTTIGEFIGAVVDTISSIFTTLWSALQTGLTNIGNFFKNIFNTVWNTIKGVVDNIKNAFQDAWNFMTGIFSAVGEFFGSVFTAAYNAITGAFNNVIQFFQGVWTTITNLFSSIGEAVGNAVKNALATAINFVLQAIETVVNAGIDFINTLIDGVNAISELVGISISKLNHINLGRVAFAEGGIVPGSSYTGDRIPAAVNSGEMVITRAQQAALWEAIESGNYGNGGSSSSEQTINFGDIIINIDGSNGIDTDEIAVEMVQSIRKQFIKQGVVPSINNAGVLRV